MSPFVNESLESHFALETKLKDLIKGSVNFEISSYPGY